MIAAQSLGTWPGERIVRKVVGSSWSPGPANLWSPLLGGAPQLSPQAVFHAPAHSLGGCPHEQADSTFLLRTCLYLGWGRAEIIITYPGLV